MTEENIVYVLGQTNVLERLLDDPNFNNMGEARYSLNGNLMLLEEDASKFVTIRDDVTIMTKSEAIAFINSNKDAWELDDDN